MCDPHKEREMERRRCGEAGKREGNTLEFPDCYIGMLNVVNTTIGHTSSDQRDNGQGKERRERMTERGRWNEVVGIPLPGMTTRSRLPTPTSKKGGVAGRKKEGRRIGVEGERKGGRIL